MITLNLETKSEAQKRLKAFLEQNASETLADKINAGVYIEKDGKRLLNKKNLDGFIKYAAEQAKKQAAKGETGAFVADNTVFGWLIHYMKKTIINGKAGRNAPKSDCPRNIPRQTATAFRFLSDLFKAGRTVRRLFNSVTVRRLLRSI